MFWIVEYFQIMDCLKIGLCSKIQSCDMCENGKLWIVLKTECMYVCMGFNWKWTITYS